MKKALIIVDAQNDFIPGGSLAVPEGDAVVPVANKAMGMFDLVVATQDWHPADHGSFASQHRGRKPGDIIELTGREQILWPDHCIQNTKGADFAPGLNTGKIDRIFHKGTDRTVDSYSGFFDNARVNATGLEDYLKTHQVKNIAVLGLATDYCVKFTALDAISLGFNTGLIKEGIRGVEIQKGDCEKAILEMTGAGINIISIHEFQSE